MSADNWRVCPRCKLRATAEKLARRAAAAKVYGKVPPDEWKRMCDEAEATPEPEDTLREDYELFTNEEGSFYVGYSCRCTTCGFAHNFKHQEQLKILEAN